MPRARNVLRFGGAFGVLAIGLLAWAAILFLRYGSGALAVKVRELASRLPGALGRASFLRLVRDELARQLEELRPDLSDAERKRAGEIVAAQAALETGYGKTPAWLQGWNFGNVTAGSSWVGPVVQAGDREPDRNDRDGDGDREELVPISARFRKYESLAAATSDFLRLLMWTRYRPALEALVAGDAAGYVAKLRAGGYFTAPLDGYRAGVLAALELAEELA